jgi:transposase
VLQIQGFPKFLSRVQIRCFKIQKIELIRENSKFKDLQLQPSFAMVYRQISADMKRRTLQLLDSSWKLQDIADVLGVSPRSVDRWHNNYHTQGRVDPLSFLQGRRRILSADVVEELCDLIQESPGLYLDEIGLWLALYHDVQISTTGLHDNLRELGLPRKIMRRAAAERDHEFRANWMYHVLNTYTAEQMVILDESSKDDRTLIRKYGRAASGDDPVLTVSLDRGIRYSILPALTLDGYLAVRAVEGSIDGEEFFDFIVNDLVYYSSCSVVSRY